MPGDCGSWVINPTDGSVYGIIIATAPEAHESYLIPASKVFDSIKSKLPPSTSVEFPTSTNGRYLGDHMRLPKLPRPREQLDLRAEWRAGESPLPKSSETSYPRPSPPTSPSPPQDSRRTHSQSLLQRSSSPYEDPYTILGVEKDADQMTIRGKHRELLLKCHPDRIKDGAERPEDVDEFIQARQAYELLSDPARRARYDNKVKLKVKLDESKFALNAASSFYARRPVPSPAPRNEQNIVYAEQAPQRSIDIPQLHQVLTARPPSITSPAAAASTRTGLGLGGSYLFAQKRGRNNIAKPMLLAFQPDWGQNYHRGRPHGLVQPPQVQSSLYENFDRSHLSVCSNRWTHPSVGVPDDGGDQTTCSFSELASKRAISFNTPTTPTSSSDDDRFSFNSPPVISWQYRPDADRELQGITGTNRELYSDRWRPCPRY